MNLPIDGDEFLSLVDELRKRGAMQVSWCGFSATFAAPYHEPEPVPVDEAQSDEMRRISLNENEREELRRLRNAKTMYAELGLADED